MYRIFFSKSARKEFEKLERPLQARIKAVLERIKFFPEKYVKKLEQDICRLRVGDYRLIMEIKNAEQEIWVNKVGHRKNIYDRL
ncbi:MAG: type II toxin-antitoxin system RelE/ParE family toxin [archaeon]